MPATAPTGRIWPGPSCPWFALRYGEDRVPQAVPRTIANTMPNRIAYLDALELDMHPRGARYVPLLTASGFSGIINRSENARTVTARAADGSGRRLGPATVSPDAGAVMQLDAGDRGIAGAAGPWRLELSTTLRIQAAAYARNSDGSLAGLRQVAEPVEPGSTRYRVPFFIPRDDADPEGLLRLIRLGTESAAVVVSGTDDTGTPSSGAVGLTLKGDGARVLKARELEQGGPGRTGSPGNGSGQWRLLVSSDRRRHVMSLARSRTSGDLASLSR